MPAGLRITALLTALLSSGVLPASALPPDFIAMSAAQGAALGIATRAPETGGGAAAAGLPATVGIPNGQQRVISAPLAGVIEGLETAPGLDVVKGQVMVRMASPQALELQRDRIQADAQATLARQSLQRDEQLFREGLIAESRLQASRSNATQAWNSPLPSIAVVAA
jgi:multidrug efflux pump subunit AcrA (membrane-fusion protein)